MTDSLHYLKIKVIRPYNDRKNLVSYYSIPNGTIADVKEIVKDIKPGTEVHIYYEG